MTSLCAAPSRCSEESMTNSTDSLWSAPVDSARRKLIGSDNPWDELTFPPKAVSSVALPHEECYPMDSLPHLKCYR